MRGGIESDKVLHDECLTIRYLLDGAASVVQIEIQVYDTVTSVIGDNLTGAEMVSSSSL